MAIDYSRGEQYGKGITRGQFEAITEAMRLIAEDDREQGHKAAFVCRGCGHSRSGIGAVDYEGIRLCNECATGYEFARITHTAGSCAEYVAARVALQH